MHMSFDAILPDFPAQIVYGLVKYATHHTFRFCLCAVGYFDRTSHAHV